MASQSEKGQIFLEIIVLMLFVTTVFFAAQRQFVTVKDKNSRYQFSKEPAHGKMAPTQNRY